MELKRRRKEDATMKKYLLGFLNRKNSDAEEVRALCVELFFLLIICIAIMLGFLTPVGRTILHWISFLMFGSMILVCVIIGAKNIGDIRQSYIEFKRQSMLEEFFSDVEAEEDEPAQISCEDEAGHVAVFYDCLALLDSATDLYPCFLTDKMDKTVLHTGFKNPDLYIFSSEYEKLVTKEENRDDSEGEAPYFGYSAFVRTHFKVLPEENSNEKLEIYDKNKELITPESDEELFVAKVCAFKEEENAEVMIVTRSERIERLAFANNIFRVHTLGLGDVH